MLRENWRLVSRIERIGDFAIIVLAFFAAYYGRSSLVFWNDLLGLQLQFKGPQLAPLKDYAIVLGVAVLSYGFFLNWMDAYSSMRMSTSWRLLRVSILSSIFVFITLAATLFLLKIDLSRSFIALFCGLVSLSLTAERYIVLEFLRYWRRRGWNFRNVIVCGIGEQAIRIAAQVRGRSELGIRIRGFADLRDDLRRDPNVIKDFRSALRNTGYSTIGRIICGTTALERALKEYAIDEVIFTDVVDVMPAVEELILVCSEQGIRTTIAADLFSVGMVKSGLSYFGDMPLIHFQTPPGDRWELALKRWIDIVASALLLVLLAPLFLLLALAIKFDSPGAVIFRQKRVGLNGRLFDLYKFRSMQQDADGELAALR